MLALLGLAAPPPNIVYIMADDLGYGEVGFNGQQKIKTPNVDRLAAEGMRFSAFYSPSTVCAPTRCSLLTGKHQGHAAIRGNKEAGGFKPNDLEGQEPLPLSETTIAEALKARGYKTGIVGKWGLGGPGPDSNPLAHGFDRFYGYLCQRRAHNYYPPYLWSDWGVDLLPGNPVFDAHQKIDAALATEDEYYSRYTGQTYSPEAMLTQAVSFIQKSKGSPFFLYLAPTIPHVALQAPKEWVDRQPREWDDKPYLGDKGYLPNARPHATYAAMIAFLDHMVGEVDKALTEAGVADNTIVIFTSDNGATFNGGCDREFFQSNAPWRGYKTNMYEGGFRVPFAARWKGKIAAGSATDFPAAGYDMMATLCQFAGAQSPQNDGVSVADLMLGGKAPVRDHLYFEYPEGGGQLVVRWARFKAIRPTLSKDPKKTEIYDLVADPKETKDLAKERPDLVDLADKIIAKEHVRNPIFPLPGIDLPVR